MIILLFIYKLSGSSYWQYWVLFWIDWNAIPNPFFPSMPPYWLQACWVENECTGSEYASPCCKTPKLDDEQYLDWQWKTCIANHLAQYLGTYCQIQPWTRKNVVQSQDWNLPYLWWAWPDMFPYPCKASGTASRTPPQYACNLKKSLSFTPSA